MAFLLGKKVRGRSLQKPLGDIELPQPLDPAIIDWFVFELRSGYATPEMRQQLYNGHIRLAIYVAGQYANQCPRKSADLVQESCLAIGVAIQEAPVKLVDNNFTPFCVTKMHSRCSRFLNEDRITGIPASTFRDAMQLAAENPEIQPPTPVRVVSLDAATHRFNYVTVTELNDDRVLKGRRHAKRAALTVHTHVRMCDLKEMIAESVKTEREAKVIGLRKEGYNDREIAEKLGVSNATVNGIRSKVEARFQRMEKE